MRSTEFTLVAPGDGKFVKIIIDETSMRLAGSRFASRLPFMARCLPGVCRGRSGGYAPSQTQLFRSQSRSPYLFSTAMPIDTSNPEGFADTNAYVVDSEGTIVLHPRYPDVVGTKPWDWAIEPDRARCREHYIQACMFRKEQEAFEVSIHYADETYPLRFNLFPLNEGQVLVLYTRVFKGSLTARERHVLVLVAGGASPSQIAEALGITASTARDHIASLKKKLHIHHADGFRMAAHHFGLGSDTAHDQTKA